MSEVSSTRLYLGNLPPDTNKAEVEDYFRERHGAGEIVEVKLMNGFGFIEYKDAMDARDVVPAFHGQDFNGNRLVVQFARGSKPRDGPGFPQERQPPRTRRTVFRMSMTGLAPETSWQDLKDFARLDGLDVVYSEVARERDGKGFVEYETGDDLNAAVEKIDGREFKGAVVRCVADIQAEAPRPRFRSRSPGGPRRGYGPPGGYHDDYYDRRGPPRPYSPPGYRERSPRRDYYDSRDRYARASPPRGRPPVDDYPPPPRRRYHDDPYGAPRGGGGGYGSRPPPPGGYDDPYGPPPPRGNYGRPPLSPGRRPRSPGGPPAPRGGYDGGYERRQYW